MSRDNTRSDFKKCHFELVKGHVVHKISRNVGVSFFSKDTRREKTPRIFTNKTMNKQSVDKFSGQNLQKFSKLRVMGYFEEKQFENSFCRWRFFAVKVQMAFLRS